MANVWAFKRNTFSFTADPSAGYSELIPFDSLTDLMSGMGGRLRGKVRKLAIVAHGDVSGQVQLNNLLTPSTLQDFQEEFHRLRLWLTPDARVIFFSCLAGRGPEGDDLLKGISKIVWGRHIVGFTISLLGGTPGMPTAAGSMVPATFAPGNSADPRVMEGDAPTAASENSELYAKWAQNNRITLMPIVEALMRNPGQVGRGATHDAVRGGIFPQEPD